MTDINFKARLWIYQGKGTWHFLTVPVELAERIKFFGGEKRRGWGSVPVKVTIGKTTWTTSVFPTKETQSYILPVKAAVRKAEDLEEDALVQVKLEIRV